VAQDLGGSGADAFGPARGSTAAGTPRDAPSFRVWVAVFDSFARGPADALAAGTRQDVGSGGSDPVRNGHVPLF
jgi:hypothetical protein